MEYFLGIDMGTTSIKAVAFSKNATMLYRYAIENETLYPQPGFAEQHPDKILQAVINCVLEVAAYLQQPPLCISFSAALHGLIAIDAAGIPLTNCILWSDTRAAQEALTLHQNGIASEIYQKTGVPVHAMTPLCKLLWLQKNNPDVFKKSARFIGMKEYVLHALTGKYAIDTSLATAMGLCNIYLLQWDDSILSLANISKQQLSEIVQTDAIFYVKNGVLPNWANAIPLVIGAGDGPLANLGMGIINDRNIAVTIGTSAAARRTIQSPQLDDGMQTFCYHLQHTTYVMGGASNNGASVLQWLKEAILQSNNTYTTLVAETAAIPAGSNGLLVLPFIAGERAPLWNANATAAFLGMTQQHTRAHCIKAVMEGVLLNVYTIILALLKTNSNVESIYAGGGFAESAEWVQMLADICGLPVQLPATVETSALGAVMIGAKATGHANVASSKNNLTVYMPKAASHQIYQKVFLQYNEALKNLGLLKKPLE